MKLTPNQMKILLNLLSTLELEISNKVYDLKAMPRNMDYYDELRQSIKEVRVIKSVMRKLKEEIRLQ